MGGGGGGAELLICEKTGNVLDYPVHIHHLVVVVVVGVGVGVVVGLVGVGVVLLGLVGVVVVELVVVVVVVDGLVFVSLMPVYNWVVDVPSGPCKPRNRPRPEGKYRPQSKLLIKYYCN